MSDFGKLESEIAQAMLADQYRLRRGLRALRDRQKQGKPFDRRFLQLAQQLSRSTEQRAKRQAAVPQINFGDDLPVLQRREEIAAAIRDHQVVVVSGETGSGKSTQLPKICLDLGRGVAGMIGHTQPRRIAARSVAARVAEELGSPLGRDVGYKVRFSEESVALIGPGRDVRIRCEPYPDVELTGRVERVEEYAAPTNRWMPDIKAYETTISIDSASVKAAGVELRRSQGAAAQPHS